MRLYVAWPGVEPKKDQYNDTYLDVSSSFNNYNVYLIKIKTQSLPHCAISAALVNYN